MTFLQVDARDTSTRLPVPRLEPVYPSPAPLRRPLGWYPRVSQDDTTCIEPLGRREGSEQVSWQPRYDVVGSS